MDKICSNCKITFRAKHYMDSRCSVCKEFFRLDKIIRKNKHIYLKKVGKLKCKQCGKEFIPQSLRQVYCSNRCVQANMRAKREGRKNKILDEIKKEYGM